jgi:hypothetical protein
MPRESVHWQWHWMPPQHWPRLNGSPEWLRWSGLDWKNVRRGSGSYVYSERFVIVPIWVLIVACAGLTYWAWRRAREGERQRMLVGHCMACGYDLRATPARCPECGGRGQR